MNNRLLNKILFVIARGDAFGGSSLHVMDMASRLEEDGVEVKILVGGSHEMEVPKRFAARNLDFTCLPDLGRDIHLVKDVKAMFQIRKFAREFSPDLISLHSSKGGAVGRLAAFGLGIPVLYTPHCWSFVEGFKRAGVYRLLEKTLAPLATRIITVCEDERQFGLRKGVGRPDRTITVHNAVKDAFEGFEREVPGPDEPVKILMVGRFEQQKDQSLLIRSLSKLEHLNWNLTLVGDGPTIDDCKALAEQFGLSRKISFPGYSDEVEKHLKEHDLFVLSTNWEGFPRSILEAMSASLPVVVSDVGGCRESVEHGSNGYVVPGDDIAAMTTALEELTTNRVKLRKMGRASREHYESKFTFEKLYSNYCAIYDIFNIEPMETFVETTRGNSYSRPDLHAATSTVISPLAVEQRSES